jgi:hypothetical protein
VEKTVKQDSTEKKPHPTAIRLDLLKSAIALAAVLVPAAALWISYHGGQGNGDLFPIIVLSEGTEEKPIVHAEVSLGLPEIAPSYTDGKGQVSFNINKSLFGTEARITVRKNGFVTYNQQISLQPSKNFYPVYLTELKLGPDGTLSSATPTLSPRHSRHNASAPETKELFDEVKATADQLANTWHKNGEDLKAKGLTLRPEIEQALARLTVHTKDAGLALQLGDTGEAMRNLIKAEEDIGFLRSQQP